MQEPTPEGQRLIEEIAQRHKVSADAALTLLRALVAGHGGMAQFNHPELGGMGQWTQGGMTMVGDMFNQGLKARVDALCTELASLLRSQPSDITAAPAQSQAPLSVPGVGLFVSGGGSPSKMWWPAELGSPASTGSQNGLRYAVFPAVRRLAVERDGQVALYDTGEHLISGVSQQQSGSQTLTFTSQHGIVCLLDLPTVDVDSKSSAPDATGLPSTPSVSSRAGGPPSNSAVSSPEDVIAILERLADLHQKGVLTEEEFTAKKAELLTRI
jgi:Short C-terminal domain